MSVVSIDWQPYDVIVACPVGPEQPPAIILPKGEEKLSGAIAFDSNANAHLEWVGRENQSTQIVARIEAIFDLFESPLQDQKVWCWPGADTRVSKDDKDTILTINKQQLATKDILSWYSMLLYEEIKSRIKRTPHLSAVVEGALEEVACVVDPAMSLRAATQLKQNLADAGFKMVSLIQRWAAAAAYRLGPNKLQDSCLVIDWQREGLWAAICQPSNFELQNKHGLILTALGAGGEASLTNQVIKRLGKDDRFEVIEADEVYVDQPRLSEKPLVTVEALHRCGAELAHQIILGKAAPSATVTFVDDLAFQTHYRDPANGAKQRSLNMSLSDEDLADILEPLLLRIRNGLSSLKLKQQNHLPGTTCCIGLGFLLSGALDAVGSVFDANKEKSSPEDISFAPAKGALLLPHISHIERLPYDCGILLSLPNGEVQLGSLVVCRGQALPCEVSSKKFSLFCSRGQPLGVSIYLRKVDFGEGTVMYTSHGRYDLIPTINDAGSVCIRADMKVDADCQIDVSIVDLVSEETFQLEQLGILGGRTLALAPHRNIDETNGGLGRRVFDNFRSQHATEGLEALSANEFRNFLDRSISGPRPPEKLDEREVAERALALKLPDLIDNRDTANEREALQNALKDISNSAENILKFCRTYLSALLIALTHRLLDFVQRHWSGHKLAGFSALENTYNNALIEGFPLSAESLRNLNNRLVPVINRIETKSNFMEMDNTIKNVKVFLRQVVELYKTTEST